MLRLPRTMIFLVLTQAILSGASAQDKPKERVLAPLEAQRTVKSGRAETAEPGQTPDLARRVTQLIVTAQAGQASAAFSEQQKRALVQLQERTTSAVELKLNPLTGAVRQLKADILQAAEGDDNVTAQSFLRVNSKLLKIDQPDNELSLASSSNG